MGKQFTDLAIRDKQNKLVEKVKKIIDDFDFLDDQEYILKSNPKKIKDALKLYRNKLGIIDAYFDSTIVNTAVSSALKNIEKSMEQFESASINLSQKARNELIKNIQTEFSQGIETIIDSLVSKQFTKMFAFRAQAELAVIPAARLQELAQRMKLITIEGNTFQSSKLDEIWTFLTKRYGTYEQLQFPLTGHKMPLERYVEGKSITMSQETHTATAQIYAAKANINTMRFSSHGSRDSCTLHEGEIVFNSQADKDTFLANKEMVEQIPAAKSWRTVNEVRSDKTHMLVFNCRHLLNPYPVELLGKTEQKRLPNGYKAPETNREVRIQTEKTLKEKKIA